MSVNETMTALADAVRSKSGATGKLSIAKMTEAVNSIQVGGGGSNVVLGQVNADGDFQALAFSGTEASNSGDPEVVETYYTYNGVLPVPECGVGGSADYYKCASVDTVNKTWAGYKAVLTGDVYSFEDTATTGLIYGTAYTPSVGYIYNRNATVQISKLWCDGLVFSEALATDKEYAKTGQKRTVVNGTPVYTTVYGIPCLMADGETVIKYTPDECPAGNSPRTVAAWVRTDNLSQESYIIAYGSRSGTNVYFGFDCYNGGVQISCSSNSNPVLVPLEENVWAHIAAVYDGEILKMYKDGVFYGEAAFPMPTLSTENAAIQIGGTYNADYMFDGYVAGCYIYERELTSKEVETLSKEYTPVKN
jgi:hypothetical protein